MPRSYSILSSDKLSLLLDAVNEQKLPVAEACRRLKIPRSTAHSFLKHYKETGSSENKKKGGNCRPVLTEEHLNWIQSRIDKKADICLSDLQNEMQHAFNFKAGKVPSVSSIHRAIINKLHYTLKLLTPQPADYNHPSRIRERQEWATDYSDSSASLFHAVYIDESGFNLHTHASYGRAKKGQRAIKLVPSDKGENVSYIAAVGAEGIIAVWAHTGGTNADVFTWFLKTQLFPKLQHCQQIIMDNASFHKSDKVKQAFADTEHEQVLLPPYSPFLNACEWLFGYIKPRLKEQYKDTTSLVKP